MRKGCEEDGGRPGVVADEGKGEELVVVLVSAVGRVLAVASVAAAAAAADVAGEEAPVEEVRPPGGAEAPPGAVAKICKAHTRSLHMQV